MVTKTKCPKDADREAQCGSSIRTTRGERVCSRNYNHKGNHHDHDGEGKCLATW